jgi:V8-like Glu-specific endopeptidase
MNQRAWIPLSFAVAAVLVASGCASTPPSASLLLEGKATQAQGDRLFVLNSQGVDVTNRFLSTVIVTTDAPEGMCSGVLINPRLILTAGHCVCPPQAITGPAGERGSVIDSTMCAGRAYATITVYKPSKIKKQYTMEPKILEGVVRPHGDLKVILDEDHNVVSSKADLALIRLDEPVVGVEFARLARREVRNEEPLVMVGYGYNRTEAEGGIQGFRHYGTNTVTQVTSPEEALFLMERQGAHSYAGDSGGPCFRVNGKELLLVGISAKGTGKVSKFTNTYRFRAWLSDEIRLAGRRKM